MSSSSEEEEFQGDEEEEEASSSEDEPLANLKSNSPPRRKKAKINYNEADADNDDDEEEEAESSSSDDDDDIPLSALIKKKKPPPKKKNKKTPPKKKASNGSKKKKPTPKKKASSSNSSTSKKKYECASAALYNSECDKGLLIQRLLCRWWYAYEWPHPSSLPKVPPKHYDTLDGFPGVYIGTSGSVVGQIQDCRDPLQAPSFTNFAKKDAVQLKELLSTALTKQKAHCSDASTVKELDRLLKWTKKVNPTKADKDAHKVLRAHGLTL